MFTSTEIQQTIPKHTTQNTAAGIHNTYEMGIVGPSSWILIINPVYVTNIVYVLL